jgi:oligogalacturonide transport system substrate-binding protein
MRRRSFSWSWALPGALLLAIWGGGAFAQAKPVELRVSWWGGNDVHRAQLESIRLFEARYPHIRVKPEYTGWNGHLERLTTQLAGGTAPDLMQINWAWLVLFSRDGRGFHDLERLDDVIDLEQFDGGALRFGRVHGRLNAIPTAMAARVFYFNATTFAKAGLAVPRTWEELFAAGPVFRERLGEDYFPLDLNFQDMTALARSWYVQKTHKPLVDEAARRLIATPDELREIAALYRRLVDQHVIPSARERASHGHVEPQEMRPWISGRYAGTYQWISAIGKYVGTLAPGQEVVLAPYPMLAGASDAGLLYRPAMMLAISRNTRHPREAALLLDFFLNDPGAVRALGLKRGVPVSRIALETLRRDHVLHGLAWEGLQQVGTLPNVIRESGFFEHARVRDGFNDIFEALGYGRIDEREAALQLDRDMNRVLKRVIR